MTQFLKAPAAPSKWATMAAVSIGLAMLMIDTFVVNVAFPAISRDLDAGLGLEGGGPWHVVSYAIVMAIGVAIIVGVIYGALWTLAREDGRIEREVEEKTGRGPEGPGSPSSPRTDLKQR